MPPATQLLSMATFSVPSGLHGTTGGLVCAYVTYALLGLLYSLVNIPTARWQQR
jgi:glucuronide carrier protein